MKTATLPLLSAVAAIGALVAFPAPPPVSAAAPADGAMIFRQRCQSCHTAETGKVSPLGPNLSGVVGRKAGATAFAYSPALKASGLMWTRETLDSFLAAPGRKVPGTRMVISVPDPQQRAQIIGFLAATGK